MEPPSTETIKALHSFTILDLQILPSVGSIVVQSQARNLAMT